MILMTLNNCIMYSRLTTYTVKFLVYQLLILLLGTISSMSYDLMQKYLFDIFGLSSFISSISNLFSIFKSLNNLKLLFLFLISLSDLSFFVISLSLNSSLKSVSYCHKT